MVGYTIKKYENGKLQLCKILNEYDESQEQFVVETLSGLLTGKVTEEELLNELSKKKHSIKNIKLVE